MVSAHAVRKRKMRPTASTTSTALPTMSAGPMSTPPMFTHSVSTVNGSNDLGMRAKPRFTRPTSSTSVPDIQARSFARCSSEGFFLSAKKPDWDSSTAPMQKGIQNMMPRYTSAMAVAVASEHPCAVRMAAMAASTTPTPCGVGLSITEMAATANAATSAVTWVKPNA